MTGSLAQVRACDQDADAPPADGLNWNQIDWTHINAEVTRLQARIAEALRHRGGNGLFCDAVLEAFPNATGVALDNSAMMLAKNKPSPRKQLLEGTVERLAHLLTPELLKISAPKL